MAAASAVVPIVTHEPKWWLVVALLLQLGFFQSSRTVVIDERSLSTSLAFMPFFQRQTNTVSWSDVIEVKIGSDPFFVESDVIQVVSRNGTVIRIPVAILSHREDFLQQFLHRLPAHAHVQEGLTRWAEQTGKTPRWQLGLGFAIIVGLSVLLWLSVVPRK